MCAASTKLLELQLSVTQQLHGVDESLSQIPAASSPSAATIIDLHQREKELEELSRALRRQHQLVHDAHRQLLEVSTKRKPLGAASAHVEADALRAALAEQEVARMIAEARVDELQAQVSHP